MIYRVYHGLALGSICWGKKPGVEGFQGEKLEYVVE